MTDYSISKDPTATNLTQSKNSTNKVTVTKNPGSTKAYFTKSGGTEVAVVKSGGSTELSPDVNFDNGCGALDTQWTCGGSTPAVIAGGTVTLASGDYDSTARVAESKTGIGAGDTVTIVIDIVSVNASDAIEIYQFDGLGSVLATWNTAGEKTSLPITTVGGGISIWKKGANAEAVITSCSIKR